MTDGILLTAAVLGGVLWIFAFVWFFWKLLKGSVVTRLPMVATQQLELPEAGRFILHYDKPRFSRLVLKAPGSLALSGHPVSSRMVEAATGQEVPVHACILPIRSVGLGRSRTSLWSVKADRPGPYRLELTLPHAQDLGRCQLIVARPMLLSTVLFVAMLFLGVALTVGGSVTRAVRKLDPIRESKLRMCLANDQRCGGMMEVATERCESDDGWGCQVVGVMRFFGAGVEEDLPGALVAWERACELEVADACHNAAGSHRGGRGTVVDFERAGALFRQACDGGQATSCEELAAMMDAGEVMGAAGEAQRLLIQACEAGVSTACEKASVLEAPEEGAAGESAAHP